MADASAQRILIIAIVVVVAIILIALVLATVYRSNTQGRNTTTIVDKDGTRDRSWNAQPLQTCDVAPMPFWCKWSDAGGQAKTERRPMINLYTRGRVTRPQRGGADGSRTDVVDSSWYHGAAKDYTQTIVELAHDASADTGYCYHLVTKIEGNNTTYGISQYPEVSDPTVLAFTGGSVDGKSHWVTFRIVAIPRRNAFAAIALINGVTHALAYNSRTQRYHLAPVTVNGTRLSSKMLFTTGKSSEDGVPHRCRVHSPDAPCEACPCNQAPLPYWSHWNTSNGTQYKTERKYVFNYKSKGHLVNHNGVLTDSTRRSHTTPDHDRIILEDSIHPDPTTGACYNMVVKQDGNHKTYGVTGTRRVGGVLWFHAGTNPKPKWITFRIVPLNDELFMIEAVRPRGEVLHLAFDASTGLYRFMRLPSSPYADRAPFYFWTE